MKQERAKKRRARNHLGEHPPLASALLKQAAPGARAPPAFLADILKWRSCKGSLGSSGSGAAKGMKHRWASGSRIIQKFSGDALNEFDFVCGEEFGVVNLCELHSLSVGWNVPF